MDLVGPIAFVTSVALLIILIMHLRLSSKFKDLSSKMERISGQVKNLENTLKAMDTNGIIEKTKVAYDQIMGFHQKAQEEATFIESIVEDIKMRSLPKLFPTTAEEVAELVGGDPRYWLERDENRKSFVYTYQGEKVALTGPPENLGTLTHTTGGRIFPGERRRLWSDTEDGNFIFFSKI